MRVQRRAADGSAVQRRPPACKRRRALTAPLSPFFAAAAAAAAAAAEEAEAHDRDGGPGPHGLPAVAGAAAEWLPTGPVPE